MDRVESNMPRHNNESYSSDEEVDPIDDIIDYLVRCARISFKNSHVDEVEVRTNEKIKLAHQIYQKSASNFLSQFGKYMTYNHLNYFDNLKPTSNDEENWQLKQNLEELKAYHSEEGKRKRVRNRRFKAMQKLQVESDYFSEKEMMFRNPLLYEQLVGQFLTDDEIQQRDQTDCENLTFVNMILDTVDRNKMRLTKNEQRIAEGLEPSNQSEQKVRKPPNISDDESDVKLKGSQWGEFENNPSKSKWGDFQTPDATPTFEPEPRMQSMISAPERKLLREEFLQEMYSSFIDGHDQDFDYNSVDNNEQYDDLLLLDRDKEEKYFDSEPAENDNLEENMALVHEYGRKNSKDSSGEDELEVFMSHLNKRQSFNN